MCVPGPSTKQTDHALSAINRSGWRLPTISHARSRRRATHRFPTLSFLALSAGRGITYTHTRGALTDGHTNGPIPLHLIFLRLGLFIIIRYFLSGRF